MQGTLAINSPYPAKLGDYANPNIEKLVLNLTLTDLNLSNKRVRLKIFIQKQNSLIAQSVDMVAGEGNIVLDGGVPQRFTSIELARYFKAENLQGINGDAYSQTLPEGVYTIGFEVYDFFTGNKLSGRISQLFWLMLSDPPLLNMPRNKENIIDANPNNTQIVFQWTPRSTQVTNTEYEFTLSELWDDTGDPYQQFLAAIPKYQTTLSNTTLLYGLSAPPLLAGRTYAWQVKAKAKAGFEDIGLYRQNGYSEIFVFKYAGQCAAVSNVVAEVKSYDRININWQQNIDQRSYKVTYRKYTPANKWKWFETTVSNIFFTLAGLEANTDYELKVGGICNDGLISYSQPQTVRTLADGQLAGINCGQVPVIDISNKTELKNLAVNDVVMANDFPITVTTVEGSGGSFSGIGWVKIPWLADTKIKVKYSGIKVNTDHKLIEGFFETTYDPSGKNVGDVDQLIKDVVAIFNEIKDLINKYDGTDTDKANITKVHIDLEAQYESLVSSSYLSQVQKDDLSKSRSTNKHCFEALEQGKTCDSATVKNTGNGPYIDFENMPFSNDYDCYKAGAIKLVDAMATARAAENEAMQKDFLFTDDDGNKYEANPNPIDRTPALGLSPNGKIITKVNLPNSNQRAIPIISKAHPYFITGFDIYEDTKKVNEFVWKTSKELSAYYDNKINALPISRTDDNRYVNIYKESGDGCSYKLQDIQWQNNGAITDFNSTIESKIVEQRWKNKTLFNADSSCFKNFIKDIKAKDDSPECSDAGYINAGYQHLLAFVNAASIDDVNLTDTINNVCITSIRNLSYIQIEKLIKHLGLSNKINNQREIAILRLMNAINTRDYPAFFTTLETNSKTLLKSLITKVDDAFYPWDENNSTNFIGSLLWMYNTNPSYYQKKLATIDDDKLSTLIINLEPKYFADKKPTPGFISLHEFKFTGEFDETTGNINIFWAKRVHPFGASTVPLDVFANEPQGAKPLESISPLSPLVITTDYDVPLVQSALEGLSKVENCYLVPAIFLWYKHDKELKEKLSKTGMITLDALTIAMSGGVALASKISWIRRIWALAEVAGAAGNIGVNLGAIEPNSKLGTTLGYYNAAMAIIGVKNIGTGVVNFAKNLPAATKNLIKNNGNLRAILISKYLDYRIAVTQLQNSDEWVQLSAEVRQSVTSQNKFFNGLM